MYLRLKPPVNPVARSSLLIFTRRKSKKTPRTYTKNNNTFTTIINIHQLSCSWMIQTTFLCFLLSSNFRIQPTLPLQLRCRSSWPGGVPQKLKRLSAGTIQNSSKRWQKLLFNITIQVSKCSKNLDCFFLKTFSFGRNSSLKMVLNPTPRAHIGGIWSFTWHC